MKLSICLQRQSSNNTCHLQDNFYIIKHVFPTTIRQFHFSVKAHTLYVITTQYLIILQRLILNIISLLLQAVAQLYIFMFSCLHRVKVSFTLFSFLMQYNFITGMRLPSNNKIQETTLVQLLVNNTSKVEGEKQQQHALMEFLFPFPQKNMQ